MTLLVSGSTISIQNSAGATKFTSDDKLVYKRAVSSGSIVLGGANGSAHQRVTLGSAFIVTANDFPIVQVKITACSGNLVQDVIGSQVMLNFAMPIHFERGTTDAWVNSYCYLSSCLLQETVRYCDGTSGNEWFLGLSFYETRKKIWYASTPSISISLDWRATLLSYR